MQRYIAHKCVIPDVLLITFTAVALLWPFSRTVTFCCAYFCGAFAILVFRRLIKAEADVRHRMAYVGVFYAGAQLFMSLVELALADVMSVSLAVTSNVILAALATAVCSKISADQYEITDYSMADASNAHDVTQLQAMAASMLALCGDQALREMLARIADDLNFIGSAPSPIAKRRTNKMFHQLNDVRHAIYYGDADSAKLLCTKLLGYLGERLRNGTATADGECSGIRV